MVLAKDKKKMSQFLCDRLDEKGTYNIISSDTEHVLFSVKEKDAKIYVVLHNFKRKISDYKRLVRALRDKGIYTCDLLYKDGELFHVRMGSTANFKGDDRSLKRYEKKDLDKMLHLRGLEKEVLLEKTLVYYQPETLKLSESIRGYSLSDVTLDYSHVDSEHKSYNFVENRTSIDYKIADEKFSIPPSVIGFKAHDSWSKKVVIVGR
jgi:hypothetical protein